MPRLIALCTGLLALLLFSFGAVAQSAPTPPPDTSSDDDATALAKKLQNPIGDLYSFPFQNNTNFNTGPHKGTQDILNVQPVISIQESIRISGEQVGGEQRCFVPLPLPDPGLASDDDARAERAAA